MTWQNSNYSSKDIMSMQQDAMRRVREMQRIANNNLNGVPNGGERRTESFHSSSSSGNAPNQQHPSGQPANRAGMHAPPPAQSRPRPEEHHAARQEKKPEEPNNAPDIGNFIDDFLSQLHLDHDRLIILVLLLFLMREGTDWKLLLALCYLLL